VEYLVPIWTRSPIWSYQFWRLLNSVNVIFRPRGRTISRTIGCWVLIISVYILWECNIPLVDESAASGNVHTFPEPAFFFIAVGWPWKGPVVEDGNRRLFSLDAIASTIALSHEDQAQRNRNRMHKIAPFVLCVNNKLRCALSNGAGRRMRVESCATHFYGATWLAMPAFKRLNDI